MCRALAITARALSMIVGAVIGTSVISSPASALSHEEWVMAFVRFVEWPTPIADNTLVVCLPPDSPALELDGKQVRGLTLQVAKLARPRDLAPCHVFAALSRRDQDWTPWLNVLKMRPILAVGLGGRFCELGGTVCLIRDEGSSSEKYQLNLDSLSRSGFRVSSQLLRAQPQRPQKNE
jgi:YfiR/HmsC-like